MTTDQYPVAERDTDRRSADNGVDIEALRSVRAALTETREAAEFTFVAENEWVHGAHSRTTVERFHGLGVPQTHRRAHAVETDHPEVFAAADNGPTPPELILMGLAGCLTTGVAAAAQRRGIQLRAVRAIVAGRLDPAGMLGVDEDVRNGFSDISVRYEIDANAPRDVLEAIVAQSQERSAVFDIVSNPTPVVVLLT